MATAPAKTSAAKPAATAAKPGDPAPAAKKDKPKKVTYPGLNPDDKGKATSKLKEWPTDHDPKQHKPLRKQDFENEAPFLEHQADELETRAKKLRQDAVEARTMGSQADRAKAKKLRQMQDKMAELRKQLEAEGYNVDEMLGKVATEASAPTA